jgi:hypothetical protein
MFFIRPLGMQNCVENGKMEWMDEEEMFWMRRKCSG